MRIPIKPTMIVIHSAREINSPWKIQARIAVRKLVDIIMDTAIDTGIK